MLSIKQQNKVFASVKKLGPIEIILAPHRIANKCIVHARTAEAKSRLVQAVEILKCEDMKRHLLPGYDYPVEDKKHGYKPESSGLLSWLKNLWK